MNDPTRHCWCALGRHGADVAACVALAAWGPPALAQDTSTTGRPTSYGAEIAFGSGHADRGYVISDRPVVQPVTWVSGGLGEFSLWSSFTLAQNTDGSRPQIVELELTRRHAWGRFSLAPAVTTFFYRDLLSIDQDHSIQGWLYLSYDVGPFRVYANQSLDVLAYQGAYYAEAGIMSDRRVSPTVELETALGAGWASGALNNEYADVAISALTRLRAEVSLTAHVRPPFYLGPHLEFSTIVDDRVRAGLLRPTYLFFGLTAGVEH